MKKLVLLVITAAFAMAYNMPAQCPMEKQGCPKKEGCPKEGCPKDKGETPKDKAPEKK